MRFVNNSMDSIDDTIKNDVKKMLNSYEDRLLKDHEHRVLQGVLSTDFHVLENMEIEESRRKESIKILREN